MITIRRITISFFVLVLLGVFIIAVLPQALPVIIKKHLEDSQDISPLLLGDDIQIVTVGTGTPMSANRASTATAVFIKGHFFLFDIGPGAVREAELAKLPLSEIEAVFITHWHSDHFMDLPNLINRSWVQGREHHVTVYGPSGLKPVMFGVEYFTRIENELRLEHHGQDLMDPEYGIALSQEFSFKESKIIPLYSTDGINISAFQVDHRPVDPAAGYLIEYNGKKIVISGDTRKSELLQEVARNADVLIHEVMLKSFVEVGRSVAEELKLSRSARIMAEIQGYHTSPSEVAEIAEEAGVKKLILNHMAPSPDNLVIKNAYKKEMDVYRGELVFSDDGDHFVVD